MFTLILDHRDDRHTQVFCDTEHHIEIVYPLHEHSGETPGLELSDCDCTKQDVDNAAVEGDGPIAPLPADERGHDESEATSG